MSYALIPVSSWPSLLLYYVDQKDYMPGYGAQAVVVVVVFGWCAHHGQTPFLVLLSHILVAVLMRLSCGTHTLVLRGGPSKPWCSGLHRHGAVPGEILCRCARDHSECWGVRTALGMWQLGKWWGMEVTALCTQSPCSTPLNALATHPDTVKYFALLFQYLIFLHKQVWQTYQPTCAIIIFSMLLLVW